MPGPPHPCLSLSAYVDGRLPTWRRAVVERHLGACTRCALEVAQIRALRRFLVSPAPPEAPPGLQERLRGIAHRVDDRADDRADPPSAGEQAAPTSAREPADPTPTPAREPVDPTPAWEPAGAPARDLSPPRPLVGAVGVMAASLLVLGAAGAGALVTGMTTPAPGTPPRASLTTVLPRLLSWPADPGGAATVRPVDNGDRP